MPSFQQQQQKCKISKETGNKGVSSESESCSVRSDSLQPHGILQSRIQVGSFSLLQGIFPNQRLNPQSPALQADSTEWATREAKLWEEMEIVKKWTMREEKGGKNDLENNHSNTVHKKARIWYLRSCVGKMHCVFLCFLAHSASDIICMNFFSALINSIQFWYYLPGDGVRSHKLSSVPQDHTTSDTNYNSRLSLALLTTYKSEFSQPPMGLIIC